MIRGEPLKTFTSVNQRLSPEFVDTSKHYSELSKKNRTPCTLSCKRMTRLREDLAQMKSLHQETQYSIEDDAVSQVMGKEHRGRVQGMGHGVTPSIVQVSVVGKQNFAQYQKHVDGEMTTMKQTIANLTNLLMTHLLNIDQAQVLTCLPSTQLTQYSSDLNPMRFSKSVQFADPSAKSISWGSSSQVDGLNNNQCKLLDWMGKEIVVVEAEINSKDPYTKVHHLELGPDFWRVSVKKVMISVSLPRPTNKILTLKDALNSFITWPTKYIVS